MSLRVLAWQPEPGQPLPIPLLADDSDQFPIEAVKQVRAWLAQSAPEFHDAPPTATVVTLSRPAPGVRKADVQYSVGEGVRETLLFRHSTMEILLKNSKYGTITAKFRYLVARDESNRVILGPMLRAIQEERVN